MRSPRRPTPLAWPSALLVVPLISLLLAACAAVPSRTPNASPSSGPTAVPGDSEAPSGRPGEPSQTDTDWGRIWDALPVGFPEPAGSSPSEPIGREPSSAELSVGAAPTEVTDFYAAALAAAGYLVGVVQGPLEDGTRVIAATGGASGCKVQVSVTPLSGVTHVTVLFAAACPFR